MYEVERFGFVITGNDANIFVRSQAGTSTARNLHFMTISQYQCLINNIILAWFFTYKFVSMHMHLVIITTLPT